MLCPANWAVRSEIVIWGCGCGNGNGADIVQGEIERERELVEVVESREGDLEGAPKEKDSSNMVRVCEVWFVGV